MPSPPTQHTIVPPVVHAEAPPLTMSLNPAEPRELRIDKLGLIAAIENVGMANSGEMQNPANEAHAAWYKLGYLPGSKGQAVIAGHSWLQTGKGIFYNLDTLQPGDQIEVVTSYSRLLFKVTAKQSFAAEQSTGVVFNASDYAGLNLITCSGAWDPSRKQYQQRLVVFSEFSGEEPLAQQP